MKHAPAGYDCPFCRLAGTLPTPAVGSGIVLVEPRAVAMQDAFGCEGFSTRQHNGPAGDQDVWHYHLHVFPRFPGDGLWGGRKAPYEAQERLELAERLRAALR